MCARLCEKLQMVNRMKCILYKCVDNCLDVECSIFFTNALYLMSEL